MSRHPRFPQTNPDGESAHRNFPFIITDPELKLEDFEIGLFTFLYFRCSDRTYFIGNDQEKNTGKLGKIAYWSYTAIHKAIGTSRTRISRTMQLFENADIIGYINRPRNRKTIEDQITYVTRTGKKGMVGSNVYAMFIAPLPSQKTELAQVILEEREKLKMYYLPDGRLRHGTEKWSQKQAIKTRKNRKFSEGKK